MAGSPLASFGSTAHHDDEHDEEHGPATTPTVFDKVRFNILMSTSPQMTHWNNIFFSIQAHAYISSHYQTIELNVVDLQGRRHTVKALVGKTLVEALIEAGFPEVR